MTDETRTAEASSRSRGALGPRWAALATPQMLAELSRRTVPGSSTTATGTAGASGQPLEAAGYGERCYYITTLSGERVVGAGITEHRDLSPYWRARLDAA
jgi:hypothetical protein